MPVKPKQNLLCAVVVLLTPADFTVQADCPMPFVNVSDRCLFFDSLTSGAWSDCRAKCLQLQGDLVMIDDGCFFKDIVDHIVEYVPSSSFWIGASDEGLEGEWQWTDGTSVMMGVPFWGTFGANADHIQPNGGINENCASLRTIHKYYFTDQRCSDSYSPLCQYGGSL